MKYRMVTGPVRWALLCVSVALLIGCGSDDSVEALETIKVTASAGEGGTITPLKSDVPRGASLHISAEPKLGYRLQDMTGCGGTIIKENRYKSAAIEAPCHIQARFETGPIEEQPSLQFSETGFARGIGFKWDSVPYALRYTLYENRDGQSGFSPIAPDLAGGQLSYETVATLYQQLNAEYYLEACNDEGCMDSERLSIDSSINQAIGYVKRQAGDDNLNLGYGLAFSDDGKTLAASAPQSCQSTLDEPCSGVVYVYRLKESRWQHEASISLSNAAADARFGERVSLSADGNTLAISAPNAFASGAEGVTDRRVGAAYVYQFKDKQWTQVHAINGAEQGENDTWLLGLGSDMALSGDGNTLALVSLPRNNRDGQALLYRLNSTDDAAANGAPIKRFNSVSSVSLDHTGSYLALGGRNASGEDERGAKAGVAQVYHDRGANDWQLQTELRGPDAFAGERFGNRVLLSRDGRHLLVGVDHDSAWVDTQALEPPKVYLYQQDVDQWSLAQTFSAQQQTTDGDNLDRWTAYGVALAISGDGSRVLIGDPSEAGDGRGIFANSANGKAALAGAAYLYQYIDGHWQNELYLKAKNTAAGDRFGEAVSISADGSIIAVGAPQENGSGVGVDANVMPGNGAADGSGAVYLY